MTGVSTAMADPFNLTDVKVTTKELGRGAFGVVKVLYFKGLKCAGKIIYKDLCEKNSHIITRYEKECLLLSQLHHPNIVQFLGTYSENASDLPVMVMELLATNLSGCLATYEILPEEISYSILQDVALGLHYLHTRSPAVIHRDLSANNVLLSPDMTAKISDLGMAKILNLSIQKLVETMTKAPGTLAYMPPEALVNDPKYDVSIDQFSYGIMIVHVLVGQWPTVESEAVIGGGNGSLVAVSEFDRRIGYLEVIGLEHPLMGLIRQCLHNIPEKRAKSGEIVKQIQEVAKTKPKSYSTCIEMLKRIEELEMASKGRQKVIIQHEMDGDISKLQQKHEEELKTMKTEAQETYEQRRKKQFRSSLVHSSEIAQLKQKLASITTAKKAQEKESEALSCEIDIFKQGAKKQKEQLDKTLEGYDERISEIQQSKKMEVDKIRDEMETVKKDKTALATKNDRLKLACTLKQQEVTKLNGSLRSRQVEVEQKKGIIEQNETTIQTLSDQLTSAREYLAVEGQRMQAEIEWLQCKSCSEAFSQSSAVMVDGKIYCSGSASSKHSIFAYDPFQDVWLTGLPPLQVSKFGLGQINGKVVAVGGLKSDKTVTNEIVVYDYSKLGTVYRKWKRSVPAMPTARHSPTVVSDKSLLLVAGGVDKEVVNNVEIHNSDTGQWSITTPLPFPSSGMSPVVVGDQLYLVGGFLGKNTTSSKAISVSLDSLRKRGSPLESSRGRSTSSHRPSVQGSNGDIRMAYTPEPSDTTHHEEQLWHELCDTPRYGVTGVHVSDSLLVLGGEASAGGGAVSKDMYGYSSKLDMWVKVGSLPSGRLLPCVFKISPFHIVLIGGLDSNNMRSGHVYKGSLNSFI